MKKILLGTTALVATGLTAGAANASALKVDVNGYYTGVIAHVDSDVATIDDIQVKHEGEISVNGSVTLDNGLTAGVEINIEATNDVDASSIGAGSSASILNGIAGIDEAYAYLEGSFGRVQLGSEGSAPFLMHFSAPYFVGSHGVDSPNFGYHSTNSGATVGATSTTVATTGSIGSATGVSLVATQTGGTARTATYITLSGDNNKITYFSPRFSGVQLGISYTPDNTCNVDAGGQVGGASRAFRNTGDCAPTSNVANLEDVIEVGANYTGTFNDVGIGASIGYATADYEDGAGGTPYAVSMNDPEVWSFGLQLTSGAFTLGGGYYMSENVGAPGVAGPSATKFAELEEEAWSIALQYVTGPWTVGAGYFESENETGLRTKDEYEVIEVGGTYSLGDGVDVFAVAEFYETKNEVLAAMGPGGSPLPASYIAPVVQFADDTTAIAIGIDLAF